MDNDSGALLTLLENLKAQEVKEAVLAYFFLLYEGKQTEKELDEAVEHFLNKKADKTRIDFESSDAIKKLKQLDLVVESDGVFGAIPLDEALRKIELQWTEGIN